MLDEQYKALVQFMILSSEVEDKRKEETENSLTFFRLIYLFHEFRWIRNCISQNAYHQAIRELRFILDSTVQAYYIDREHPDSKMQCKLEIVKELDRLHRGQLIEHTDLKKDAKQKVRYLYEELCKYVHPSYRELTSLQSRSRKERESLEFERDPEMEKICEGLVNRTMDAAFLVALSLFPEISNPPKKFEKMRSSFGRSTEALGFELTRSKWSRSVV